MKALHVVHRVCHYIALWLFVAVGAYLLFVALPAAIVAPSVIGYGVYTKGPVYEAKTSMRDDDIPNACTPMSAPDWDVLTFIGANRTPYARYWFPEQFEPKDKTE